MGCQAVPAAPPQKAFDYYNAGSSAISWYAGGALIGGFAGCIGGGIAGFIVGLPELGVGAVPGALGGCLAGGEGGASAGGNVGGAIGFELGGNGAPAANAFDWIPGDFKNPWKN